MITIAVSELKRFFDRSKHIRDNKLLPIYSYVKLVCKKDKSVLIKSNGHSFVVCEIEVTFKKEQTVLIEEKTLSGLVAFTKSSEIKITFDSKNVKLDDGIKPGNCRFVEDNYPIIQENDSTEKIQISKDVIHAISVAKTHVQQSVDKVIRSWMCFVHITKVAGKNYVCAFNGGIGYLKSFNEELPLISIDPEMIPVLSKYTQLGYSSSGNYDYFEFLDTIYGFIKSETKCIDLTKAVENFQSAEHVFTTDREDLVGFCETVMAINDSITPPEVSLQTSGKKSVKIKFLDITGERDLQQELKTYHTDKELPETFILPKQLLIALNSTDSKEIIFSTIKNNFILTTKEEESYMGSVMELAKN